MARAGVMAFLVVGLTCCLGCGGDWATVDGVVTIDKAPLDQGHVMFHPTGEGTPAYAITDVDGKYTLKTGDRTGLKPGAYTVTVVKQTLPEMTSANPVSKLLTPAKYSDTAKSDLKVTVTAGRNAIPLELTTK